jgi:hypothetical protein
MAEPHIFVSLLYCVSSVFYFHICFILFLCDPIFITVYSREATQDTTVVLGVRKESLYKLFGRPIIGSNGFLDSTSDSMSYSTLASEALSETRSCETPSGTIGRMSP